jgi:hypothetical protein
VRTERGGGSDGSGGEAARSHRGGPAKGKRLKRVG